MRRFLIVTFLFLIVGLAAQWTDDPAANTAVYIQTGEQAVPKVAHCPDGTMYIGWYDNATGNYNVRLQRLAYDGSPLWAEGGVLVSDHTQNSWVTDWTLIADANGNALIGFQDVRSNTAPDVVVYKITPTGDFAWGADGVQLTNDTVDNYIPRLASTDAGNVIVAWMAGNAVHVQKVSSDGVPQLTTPLVLADETISYTYPQPFAISGDQFMLKYYQDSGPAWAPTRHLYVNRYDSNVTPVWDGEIALSTQGGISAWTQWLDIVSDGADGMWTGWYDDRDSNSISDNFVAHIAADGTLAFPDGGCHLTGASNMQNFMPSLCESADGVYAFWGQTDASQNNSALVAQRVTAEGAQWGNGMTLVPISSRVINPIGAAPYNGDAIIIYSDDGSTGVTDNNIRAQRVDPTGATPWATQITNMSTSPSQKLHSYAVSSYMPQWVAVWGDERGASRDIYAQNINADGSIGVATIPSGISGHLSLQGGLGDVTQVDITVDGGVYHPLADGYYYITLDPGAYNVTFELDDYEPVSAEIPVTAEQFTTWDVTMTWIGETGIGGTVTLSGGAGDVTAVVVTAGEWQTNPDTAGGYSMNLPAGTYVVSFELEGYQSVEVADVVVVAGDVVTVNAVLEYVNAAGEDTPAPVAAVSAWPNPFNPETTVVFSLAQPGRAVVEVFDIRGRRVASLADGDFTSGEHRVVWRADDQASGVYFVRLSSADGEKVAKLVLLK